MRTLAIDPGTNSLGYALFNSLSVLIKACSIQSEGKDRYDRTQDIQQKLMSEMDSNPFFDWNLNSEQVICEEPLLRGKANKAMERLLGGLEFLFNTKIKYLSPTSVKKAMGHGTFDKSLVKASILKILNEDEKKLLKGRLADSDMTDAIAIGLAGLGRITK